MNEFKIKKGIYEHYKKKYYEVFDVVRHSETLEYLVFYRKLSDDFSLWVRPLTMFLENVDIQGEKVPRFKFISSKNYKEFLETNQNS